jgi:hypothetical protein
MAKYTWQNYKTNENILSELKINPAVKKITESNGCNMFGEWTETYIYSYGMSTMWETKTGPLKKLLDG